MSKDWLGWGVFVAVCFLAAAIGSWFTGSVKSWYPTLLKPAGTPPAWVFGPVWSTLYLLMGTAAWLVWRHRSPSEITLALTLFFAQLALNATWSYVFFGLQRPGLALLDIVALLAAIIATMTSFVPLSRLAFWLMTPYVAWVSYATFLNFGIWRLNRGAP
ncbi:MAG: tryptophan-rich sensory protein [Acidobacteriaceae bacterium]|nr:tryptophan-rich sensory protein [Acidobacteriaceae bacterium]